MWLRHTREMIGWAVAGNSEAILPYGPQSEFYIFCDIMASVTIVVALLLYFMRSYDRRICLASRATCQRLRAP